jgi:hypothetical protein
MTDNELLASAAKAVNGGGWHPLTHDTRNGRNWNPLEYDGDALRLAVMLGLAVIPYPIYAKPKHSVIAKQYDHARYLRSESEDVRVEEIQVYGGDPAAATRRAIVLAAAAMAEQRVLGAA